MRGPLLTLAAALVTERTIGTVLELPTPVLPLIAVAYTAFTGRFASTFISMGVAFVYAIDHYYQTGQAFAYSQQDFLRLLAFSIAMFAIALMVVVLRRSTTISEQQTRESEQRLRGLMETVPVGIAIVAPRGKVGFEDFNPACGRCSATTPQRSSPRCPS